MESPDSVVDRQPHGYRIGVRFRSALKLILMFQLALAITFVILGISLLLYGLNLEVQFRHFARIYTYNILRNIDGCGIWGGSLLTITATTGAIWIFRRPNSRCLIITYFILNIISVVFCIVMLIVTSLWSAMLDFNLEKTTHAIVSGKQHLVFARRVNVVLAVLLSTEAFASVVSTSLLCEIFTKCCCYCCRRFSDHKFGIPEDVVFYNMDEDNSQDQRTRSDNLGRMHTINDEDLLESSSSPVRSRVSSDEEESLLGAPNYSFVEDSQREADVQR